MISQIRGEVVEKNDKNVVVEANGIGYQIFTTDKTLDELVVGDSSTLFTYFSVRENAQDLYGFLNRDTKKLFELLLGVSGVGPKVALSIVGLGSAEEVKSAIASNNVSYIVSASGVGKRGAEKIIVELKDKVGVLGDDSFVLDSFKQGNDALDGLVALGYSVSQANQALSKVDNTLTPEEQITMALKELGR